MISLINDTIDNQDIDSLIDWLKTYPRLTKGEKTEEFERQFAKYIGIEYAVYVNSGSSANLLMLYSLIEEGLLSQGDKIIVPDLSWATDLAPVMQLGLVPILCDCNLEDLSIDLDHLEFLIEKHELKALLLVSVLGLVPHMDIIIDICEDEEIILLEDCCESLGSEFNSKKLGSFGLMSSYSMFFGHHISTIEGGMICTDDYNMYNILKSLRSHGWNRDLDPEYKNMLNEKWQIDEFNSLYTFYYSGFNLRSTDLQAFLGINQLKKLDSIVKSRQKNYELYNEKLNIKWSPISHGNITSNFAYPIIHFNKKIIIQKLKENHIDIRPLLCGSMGQQPVYCKEYDKQFFANSDMVNQYGFYIPNHPDLTEENIIQITDIINKNSGSLKSGSYD